MSLYIPLQAVPNQSLSAVVDGINYGLVIKTAVNVTVMTVIRDNVTILSNTRAVFGTPIIPYRYQEDGNFIFTGTMDDTLPIYTNFGVTQFLLFYSADELDNIRGDS